MKKQMIWGLGVLILLIGIAGVFLLILQDTNTESDIILREKTNISYKAGKKQVNRQETSIKDVDSSLTPKNKIVGRKNRDKGDYTEIPNHISIPDKTQTVHSSDPRNVSLNEVKEGHFYMLENGIPTRDESGELIQIPKGDPAFIIDIRVGFAPTRYEWDEYSRLCSELGQAGNRGDNVEVNRLEAAIKQLKDNAQRERPYLKYVTTMPAHLNTPSNKARIARLVDRKRTEVYREWGLSHLLED